MIGGLAIGAMLLHSSRSAECKEAITQLAQAREDIAKLTRRIVNLEAAAETWVKNETRQGNGVSG